ncbi:transcription initiation factor IIB [Neophaeococcomyces mojaviensis]|uniref:Transcription initiation factor IIB n=1 Tax=Neophaeococcomyces mojaviensis TaxID=3383035 RepID=A0ACC3ADB5_9EURO|nr:transcription initiation factor IIB [Knufia sp. JES_112]
MTNDKARTAKLGYSPLFVKTFARKHNLSKTYRGIKKRETKRIEGKLSGKITKSRVLQGTKLQMATPNPLVPTNGAENRPSNTPAWRDNLNIHMICPDCKQSPPDLIEENADTICANCGRVLAERIISYESEWRTFNTDEGKGDDPNRVGEAESEFLYGNQGTTIGGGGRNVSKDTLRLIKAQKLQNDDKNNRALQSAYSTIDGWAEGEHFNHSVRNYARMYYKKVYENNIFRGKNNQAVLASCLFLACRAAKVPRSFAEIMNLTKIPKKELGRTFKQLEKFLASTSQEAVDAIEAEGGIVDKDSMLYHGTQSSKPADLVVRFCDMMGMDFRVQYIATRLAEKIQGISTLAGRSPLSSAGACIYFASHLIGKGRSAAEMGHLINVSEATIKTAYKFMLQQKETLVEPDWLGPQPVNLKTGETPGVGDYKNLPSS